MAQKSGAVFRICYSIPDELQKGRFLPVCIYEEHIEESINDDGAGLFPTLKCVGTQWMHEKVLAYRKKYPHLYLLGDKIYKCYEHYEPAVRYDLLPL